MASIAGLAFWLEKVLPTTAKGRGSPAQTSSRELEMAQPSDNTLQSSAIYAIQLPDQHGAQVRLGAFSGKIVVLNFWATWCAPCREEMPVFVRMQREWANKNVQFVGISVDKAENVRQFSKEIGVNYPLLIAAENGIDLSRSMGNRLGVLPHTVVLAADGRTVFNRVGPITEALLLPHLSAKIAEKATK